MLPIGILSKSCRVQGPVTPVAIFETVAPVVPAGTASLLGDVHEGRWVVGPN